MLRKIFGWLLVIMGVLLLAGLASDSKAPDGTDVTVPILALAFIFFAFAWLLLRKKKQAAAPKAAPAAVRAVDTKALEKEAQQQAEQIVRQAREQAAAILAEAKKSAAVPAEGAKEITENILLVARQEAASIIAAAQARAEEIAGEAYAKVQAAIDYDKAIKAMRNVLQGYGNEYLIPTRNLLDELADDFGFAEAGLALKEARTHSRLLVKNGQAATCNYVEANRRNTAIAFVIDAFNGKVDTILARTRQDNLGKLQQEIKDAFALVNINGKAFMDARILPDYLAARLEEAKWGCAVAALREQAREEQRAIKERMREEERARREYEKALREAAKEEEGLQKALQKAQEEIALQVSEAQRSRLEEQIAALQAKLTDAEERATRAKSMAELTSSGHVYIISNIGSFGEQVLKIGLTRRLEPLDRVKELGDASVPFPFDVHAMIYSVNAVKLESDLHRIFNAHRLNKVNFRKEFFGVTAEQVREAVEALGHKVQFTMLAEAREYRESQAVDQMSDGEKSTMLAHILEQEAADTLPEDEGEE